MLDNIQNFIMKNSEYLIWLLNINEEHIKELSIDWAKALFVILIWFIISKIIYIYILKIFKKYKLKNKIDKLEKFLEKDEEIKENIENKKKLTERIKIDVVAAKSVSYYVFLTSFKLSLSVLWIDEVAKSLDTLLQYLPGLLVWIIIWFFGIRFANFIYDITYHTLSIAESKSKTKTSKIIATGSKWIILFLTFTLVLNFTKIIDKEMIYIILIWFISMVSLAWGIAFGLWWKDMAKNILDKFNKED